MAKPVVTAKETKLIERLVTYYRSELEVVSLFHSQLLGLLSETSSLKIHVHSFRSRLKDPEHLRDKLRRKLIESKQSKVAFKINEGNLFLKINDLVGIRILHLHTKQIRAIDEALKGIFNDHSYKLVEGPSARTWDDESRAFFRSCNISTKDSPEMYTSVHYVVESASRNKITAEIQVRTLMEEVWGEVDHMINYPHPINNVACEEQLKVLARVTSSASRLVDAIFMTVEDFRKNK